MRRHVRTKNRAILLSFLSITAVTFAFQQTAWSASIVIGNDAKPVKTVPGKILVRFKPGTSAGQVAASHGKNKPSSEHAFGSFDGLKLFTLPPGLGVEEAIAHYKKNPNVLYVEPDYEVGLNSTNDTSYSQLWALNNTGQTVNGIAGTADADMNIAEAWSNSGVTGSNSVVIAVVDSGVQYNHPDLQANMWVNPGEIAANGVDDDSNGYVDDIYGINAITNSGNPMDDNNHGTHVAGTIAAVGNNSAGITGVVQQAKIIACKFLSASGSGSSSDSLKCLDYIYALKMRGVNIIASNNSWGGGGSSQSIADAIDKHRQAGILFVAAAGNDAADNDASPHYPANYYKANVISVAATTQNDGLASFSDYGRWTVHVGAPGVNIYSTITSGSYTHFQGTSMAAPNVTGLIALLSAQDATRDWRTLKNLVISGGKPIAALASNTISGRRVRAWDTNGTGAMTCANQTVSAKLYPQASASSMIAGAKIGLAALNINCATPNGGLNVTTTGPEAIAAVTLQDDGLGFDQAAGDGIYSGYWTAPATTGNYTLNYGSTGQTYSITVVANTSTRQAYRAPVAISYNPRVDATAFTSMPDGSYMSLSGYSAYYDILFGGSSASVIYATPRGVNTMNEPTGTQTGGANSTLPNDVFETLVGAYWDDIDVSGAGNGMRAWGYYNSATAPVGEVVFEWKGVTKGTANPVQFQIVYTANSPAVEMHYIATDNNAASATTGIQVDPVRATTQNYNVANTDVAAGKAWRWLLDGGAPMANAGTTQNVNGNTLVTLSGSGSDPDGGALTYAWTQTGGTTANLSGANTLTPSFYAPNAAGILTFQLAVTDDANQTTTSSVNVNVTQVAGAGALALNATSYTVNENGASVLITVTRSGGGTGSVSVNYATGSGTATAGVDYTSVSGTLTFANGETTKTINITIADDSSYEGDETLGFNLSTPTGGATLGTSSATITIVDDESAPVPVTSNGTLELATATYSVNENGGSVTINVNRINGTTGTISVDYASADSTAIAGNDYTASSGTLSFADGETAKSISVALIDDTEVENSETLSVTLSNATGGAALGMANTTITIVDNDTAPVVSNRAPEVPALIAPANGSGNVNASLVNFEWKAVQDPDGDKVTYELYYCTDADFTACDPFLIAKASAKPEVAMLTGIGGSMGLAMFGVMGYMTRRQRAINTLILIGVTLLTTACGANIPMPGSGSPDSKSIAVTGLQANTTYYWKVIASDGRGGASQSGTWSFKTL